MSNLEALLGESLVSCQSVAGASETCSGDSKANGGSLVPVKNIVGKDKIIGLFFSVAPENGSGLSPASGCVPGSPRDCHNTVLEFYTHFKKSSPAGNNLEIVFICADDDEDVDEPIYLKYLAEMPWISVPLNDRQKQKSLMKKYHIYRIPMLVIIDGETGKVITKNGIGCIEDDPKGEGFPWRPRPFKEVIEGKLLTNAGCEVDALTALQGKITGLYFSAHWCPPCKHFTPVLSAMYDKLKSEGRNFEVVFVSSDRSIDSFGQYFKTMPWLAIPYDDARIRQLKSIYDVYGIPTLIVIDENGKVITKDGRTAVNADIQGKEFPWHVKALNELTDVTAGSLKEGPCTILLTEGNKQDMQAAKELLQELAEKEQQREEQRLLFFFGGEDEICDFFREYACLDERNPILVITDFPEEKIYVCPEPEITKDVAADFLNKYFTGKLAPEPLLAES